MNSRVVGLVGPVLALGLGFVAGLRLTSASSAPAQPVETGIYVATTGHVSQSVPGTAGGVIPGLIASNRDPAREVRMP